MALVWTFVATSALLVSTCATFLTTAHLRCRWDVRASSVRWLFWVFFSCVFCWCLCRALFFIWLLTRPARDISDDENDGIQWSYSQLDRLGIHGIIYMDKARKPLITAVLCGGDLGLFGIALTLFPLSYELWRLARKSMDRGVAKEQEMIKRYWILLTAGLLVFASVQVSLAVTFGGYDRHMQRLVLVLYGFQFLGLAFMAGLLITLKANGRKYETIHGTFIASPVYQRLKRIMLVYTVFSFQFQLSMVIVISYNVTPESSVLDFVGVSLIIYNLSGLALSVTTSCSQACVFSACAPCLPEGFEAEFMHHRFTVPADEDLEAPSVNPVFVFTDIESSTALWNVSGEMMTTSTDIHDNILRSTLTKHRGYEITTVGDAFQMAFHTIKDAIEYCMDVQLQLLVAKWPKDIDGAVEATAKQCVKRRVIFNGLRVRMGIHDASDMDGVLVQDVHAITGKTTYTGISEIIAEYVGDMGSGGQILVTDRVAAWLRHHRKDISVDVFMEYVSNYTVPQINAMVEVYQLQPAMLAARARTFATPNKDLSGPRHRHGSGRIRRGSYVSLLADAATQNAIAKDAEPGRKPIPLFKQPTSEGTRDSESSEQASAA